MEPTASFPSVGPRRRLGLTGRLLVACLGLYLVASVGITVVEVGLISLRAQQETLTQVAQAADTFGPSLSLALWNYNEAQLDILLQALAQVPAVGRVSLVSSEGVVYHPSKVVSVPSDPKLLGERRSYPLVLKRDGMTEPLGSLELEPSLAEAHTLVTNTLWVAVVQNLAVVTLLSVVLVLVARRFVGRPLRELADQIGALDSHQDQGPVLSMALGTGGELELVANRFNTLLTEVRGTIRDLRDREREILRLNASLEDKVVARTLDLDQRNRDLEATIQELSSTRTRLLEAAKMAVLGQLVAGVAHELNTPLGAALSSSRSALSLVEELKVDLLKAPGDRGSADSVLLHTLLERSHPEAIALGRREVQLRNSLQTELVEAGVDDPEVLASSLLELGISPPLGNLGELLAGAQAAETVALAQRFAGLASSCHVMGLAAGKMALVVENLLGYSRKEEAAVLVAVDLEDELETVLRLFTASIKGGISVDRHYEPVPKLVVHRDQLQQVWVNLVANAIQAMGPQGTLCLGLAADSQGVTVRVEDTGPGIEATVAAQLFTPFFTTKPRGEGTGLGLTICRRIVEEHGGKISFESAPGRTEFRVWLPLPTTR